MGRFLRPGYKSAMLEQYGGFVKLRASRNGGGLQRFCRRRMRRSCRAARRTPKSPPRTPAAAGAAPWQPPCRHLHVSSPAKYFARRREEKRRHQHQESTTASRALGAIARTEEAPLLTSMFIWERSAAPEARSHRRFKRFLDAHSAADAWLLFYLAPSGLRRGVRPRRLRARRMG